MTKATDITIIILMGTSLVVLMLEAIGNRQFRTTLPEKPHIRLLAIGALAVAFLLIAYSLSGKTIATRRPLLFINDIASIFLIINTIIAIFLGRRTLTRNQNGETYFLILAATAMSISNICTSSLVLKLVASTGWLVLMTTLAIKSTTGGKKAEIALKLGFSAIIVIVLFLFAILLLTYTNHSIDLEMLSLNRPFTNRMSFLGLILVALAGLSLAGTPPFHFGHVDCADGGNISVAFLLLSNSFIQGCALLLTVKTILTKSGVNIDNESNILGFMLIVGFMVLWLRALDQSKIRRTVAYIAASVGPLFSMSILFGVSVLLPKLIFLLAIYSFVTLTLFTLYGSLAYMNPINLPWQTWEDMSGFGRSSPLQTLTFLVALASIAGLPGTLGYFVKLSLIAPLKDSLIFSGAIFLSIAIGAACAMRVFVFMFSKTSQVVGKGVINPRPPVTLMLASLVLIALGFFPFVR